MIAQGRWKPLDDPRVLGWGSVVLVLAFWEIAARVTGVNSLYLPRPSQIVIALVTMMPSAASTISTAKTCSVSRIWPAR